MTWVLLALSFALWSSISLLLSKKIISTTSTIGYIVLINLLGIPFNIFVLFLRGGIPHVDGSFWIYMCAAAVIDLIAAVTSFYALKISPLSLLAPISSFNPLFTTFFGFLFLHETPTLPKLGGIVAITIGAYFLNMSEVKYGFLKPLQKLFSDKGVQFFLLANFLWGITPVFQKPALLLTQRHEPLMLGTLEVIIITMILFPFAKKYLPKTAKHFKKHWVAVTILITVGTFAQIGAFTAFTLVPVGYASAIFKLSSFFSIVLGATILKETHIKERLLGATIMIGGTILLAV